MSDVGYSDRIILSTNGSDDNKLEGICILCGLLKYLASHNKDKKHINIIDNIIELRDYGRRLVVRWRVTPKILWEKAVNDGVKYEDNYVIVHCLAPDADDYSKDKMVGFYDYKINRS